MRAWTTDRGRGRLTLRDVSVPEPLPGELLVRVIACGVCRTDLHVIDEDIPAHRDRVTPGHQVVGEVVAVGAEVRGWRPGNLAGIAWLRGTCGACRFCRSGRENLCESAEFTGYDDDGGYAELAVVSAAFAYRLPPGTDPIATAPLLCAGIIGYRALSRANLPPGGTLGIYGYW
ncbi:hypothetical protein C6V83_01160 [Gordonia iterans]|uniref:alcohol dehydrogenase n=1 Tax=Gordonia iterans TaxID=1004901 RepID=A0A2S0KJS4_9ACTN|nr:hypothetical protein C6V83_01160 [Gordonia iterans]